MHIYGGRLTLAPVGNFGSWAVRGGASGPIVKDKVSFGVSFAQVDRDGFTVNDVTGNDIDSRSAFTGKAQLLLVPNADWEGRVIVTGERARDGDYSLNDVGGAPRQSVPRLARLRGLRQSRHLRHDDPGAARERSGRRSRARRGSSNWKTQDVTDLDYTSRPHRHPRQHREGLPVHAGVSASPQPTPRRIRVSDAASLRWQSGVFLFTQDYEQDAINSFSPFVVAPFPSASTRRARRWTISASACSARARSRSAIGSTCSGRAVRLRGQERRRSRTSSSRRSRRPSRRRGGRDLLERLAAGLGGLSRPPDKTRLRHGRHAATRRADSTPRRRAGQRSLRRRTDLARRGRRENALGRRPRVGERRRLLHRLGRSAVERAEPGGAGAVLHLERRRRDEQGSRVRDRRARGARDSTCFTAIGYTHARFGDGSRSSGVNVEGNKIPNTPDYTVSAGRAVLDDVSGRPRCSAAPTPSSTARSSTTTRTRSVRTRSRW